MIRVVIADDNAVLRHGLVVVLEPEPDIELVGQAGNGQEAVDLVAAHAPDVVLLDVRMPVMDGVEAARTISRSARVLMLTYSDVDEVVVDAMHAGANGYLVYGEIKPGVVPDAIRRVHRGQTVIDPARTAALARALHTQQERAAAPQDDAPASPALTPRERELLALAAKGLTNAEIARELVLSVRTVRNHMSNTYTKIDVRSRTEAVAWWLTTGTTMMWTG